jgi:AAA+ ATPase superfamily predicted ATPase
MDFVGRSEELNSLDKTFKLNKSQLIVIYGRRRVGKSQLISEFIKRHSTFALSFEGLENQHRDKQIDNFVSRLKEQYNDSLLNGINFTKWDAVFAYLTNQVFQKKEMKIIVFDELQWMAAERSELISLIKYYWDRHWKDQKVFLILCGSIASFMVKKVIQSKALYGRIDKTILLKGFKPNEAIQLFKKNISYEEVLKYLLIFGGVPKYLKSINQKESFANNINGLCFSSDSEMLEEAEKIFYSQFKETEKYLKIIKLLKDKIYSAEEINKALKLTSGGGLNYYLNNLVKADIIQEFSSWDLKVKNKYKKYKLIDEFLIFHFKFIAPNLKLIQNQSSQHLFEHLCETKWKPWLSLAFERFCIKHAVYLSKLMGLNEELINFGPVFSRGGNNFQIDLLYECKNNRVIICEIKYSDKPISTKIIPEIESKLESLSLPKNYSIAKALISVNGIDQALLDSEYFDYIINLQDIFQVMS